MGSTTTSFPCSAPGIRGPTWRRTDIAWNGTTIRCRTRCAATKYGISRPGFLRFSDHRPESNQVIVFAAVRVALRHEDVVLSLHLGLEVQPARVDPGAE